MRRVVSTDIAFTTVAGATQIALLVAVARAPGLRVQDSLSVTLDGAEVPVVEVGSPHHGVMHLLQLDGGTRDGGDVRIAYRATVDGDPVEALAEAVEPSTVDLMMYLRPSRYAESDRLLPTAQREFGRLRGLEQVTEVAAWVNRRLAYVPGSSRFTDGAVETLLQNAGVCRDFAHLVVALLRGLDVPARLSAVYAPGLTPMDFHAVAEAWVEGHWHVVDATRLAPRASLLRIATGRDAADTAFLSRYGAGLVMGPQLVSATVDGDLPVEDVDAAVRLP